MSRLIGEGGCCCYDDDTCIYETAMLLSFVFFLIFPPETAGKF